MLDGLDVITIGRSSVDLYGIEVGAALEDVDRFRKSVGGCPSNIAIGTARLGLRSAVITRVGDEQMGAFIRREMVREGIDISGISTDPERLTALVLLGVRDRNSFPHIFYRENCADMALSEADIDPALIGRSRVIVVTGTHFSTPAVAAASWKAIRSAQAAGVKVVFDIDFRPSLWGLAAHAAGEERLALSDHVRITLQDVFAKCDVVVGTEEEYCAALNQDDFSAALADVRSLTEAVIVSKRGPEGCEILPPGIGEAPGMPVKGEGFTVEVVNSMGAGDAFLSGFLRGWLTGLGWAETATLANACGALAVSRLMCSSEYPTWEELQAFIKAQRSGVYGTSDKSNVDHLHWATNRVDIAGDLMVLAADHRWQFEEAADKAGVSRSRLGAFKRLAVAAAADAQIVHGTKGVICDAQYGLDALFDATNARLWSARSIEVPKKKPIQFVMGEDVGSGLMVWPERQTIKCLCHYNMADSPEMRAAQDAALLRVDAAAKAVGRELLLEIIPDTDRQVGGTSVADIITHLYGIGVKPDWWKLEPLRQGADWQLIEDAVRAGDPHCRGILILGLQSSLDDLAAAFAAAAPFSLVRGFAVGRPIIGEVFTRWLSGALSDAAAQAAMRANFEQIAGLWVRAREGEPAAMSAPPAWERM